MYPVSVDMPNHSGCPRQMKPTTSEKSTVRRRRFGVSISASCPAMMRFEYKTFKHYNSNNPKVLNGYS